MNIEYIGANKLIPYEKNAKIHSSDQITQIANSLKEFGWQQPIVIDNDNVVIIGHGRLEAAKSLNMEKVPVVRADNLTPEQVKALRLADNKLNESPWDFDLLGDELDSIFELDMSDFGFELSDGGAETPEVSEDNYSGSVPEEPRAKLGDLYQLGDHRLICGDSTDIAVIDRLMDGVKADMVFTDPPYGVDYAGKNAFLNSIARGNRIQTDIEGDALENAEAEKDRLWKPALENARKHSDDKCTYYITSPQGGELMMMMAVQEAGFQLKHTLIWNKNNHVLGRSDYNYKHEPILYGWNKQHVFYGNGEQKTSVWDIPKPQKNDLHPTMKPIELIANALLNSTKENDVVLNVFGGSGSSLIACEQLNRKCYMCELDPHYIDVIMDRWETLTGQKAVLLSEGK